MTTAVSRCVDSQAQSPTVHHVEVKYGCFRGRKPLHTDPQAGVVQGNLDQDRARGLLVDARLRAAEQGLRLHEQGCRGAGTHVERVHQHPAQR